MTPFEQASRAQSATHRDAAHGSQKRRGKKQVFERLTEGLGQDDPRVQRVREQFWETQVEAEQHPVESEPPPEELELPDEISPQEQGSNHLSPFCFSVVARMFALSVGTMMDGEHAFATSGGTAWRRRQRRLRAFRRYALWHSKMEIAPAIPRASRQRTSTATAATQTVNHVFVSAAATYAAPASVHVIEYVTPALVMVNIAPVPAVTSDVPSQQLPPACTTTTDTADDNLDVTGLVYPQFSSTAVESFSSHVVGPLPPLEEFTEPVYSRVHQEQIVAGDMTQNIIENSAVQEQVVVSLPPLEEFTEPVYNQVHHEQIAAGEMTENIAEFLLCRDR